MSTTTSASAPALAHGQHVIVNLAHLDTVPATVESAEGATVTVVLTVRDARVARMLGREIYLEAMSGRGINRFTGVLKSDTGGVLTLAMTGAVERIQRREFVRVDAIVPVAVQGVEPALGGETTTLDVSGRGIRIADPWDLPMGLEVRLEIRLPEGSVRALGKVVREAAPGERGIEFEDLQRPDEDRIIKFIRDRELQALRAKRNVK